jgi:hypothetical protein
MNEGGVALARLAGVGFGHERHDRGGGGVDALHDQLAAGAGLGLLALLPDLLVAGNAQAGAFLLQFELGGVQVVLLPSRHRLPSGMQKSKREDRTGAARYGPEWFGCWSWVDLCGTVVVLGGEQQ